MKKTRVWQVLRSACVGGWLTAGLFVAVDMGVWAQESFGTAAYDGMSLDAAPNGAGLWDCVEGKFYPNKGGTAFNTP